MKYLTLAPSDLECRIRQCVDSRRPEEVRLLQEREAKLATFDVAIAHAAADAKAGRIEPATKVFDRLKESVSCATILERIGGWRLDARKSTLCTLKYRRREAEILFVSHKQRG